MIICSRSLLYDAAEKIERKSLRQITIADWMLLPRGARSVCRIAVTGRLCDQTYYKKIVSRTALREVLRTIFGTISRHFSRKFAAALGRRVASMEGEAP